MQKHLKAKQKPKDFIDVQGARSRDVQGGVHYKPSEDFYEEFTVKLGNWDLSRNQKILSPARRRRAMVFGHIPSPKL